jgi:hypothetical protein
MSSQILCQSCTVLVPSIPSIILAVITVPLTSIHAFADAAIMDILDVADDRAAFEQGVVFAAM